MYLSQEVTNKDQQLKSQMEVWFQDEELKNTEKIWQESEFFDDHRSDLTIPKAEFPEHTLYYVNQDSVLLAKGGSQVIYLEYVVLGQLMVVANPDRAINLKTHVFQEKEVLLYVPVDDKATDLYGGLKKILAHITLDGGDDGERC